VDLVAREIRAGELVAPFEVDDYVRWRLMEGLDDIGITMQQDAEISAFESRRPAFKPTTA
jgi:3-isopropylmalate/(R)-2-methylmalate dehydratase small subunit